MKKFTVKFLGDSRMRNLYVALMEYLALGDEPKYKQNVIEGMFNMVKKQIWDLKLNFNFQWKTPTSQLEHNFYELLNPNLNILVISSLLHDVHYDTVEQMRNSYATILPTYKEKVTAIMDTVILK